MSTNWRAAPLEPADFAMLEFCEKLTLAPAAVVEQDVVDLRAHDFGDREILSIVLAAAYRNYIVRVADALGVELNPSVDYAPELIRAFGVDDQEAYTTLYADRLAKRESAARPAQHHGPPVHRQAGDRVAWIQTMPSAQESEQFRALREALIDSSQPAPLEHLALAFALRPDALAVTVEYLRLVGLGGSGLGQRLEALIGLRVAATLGTPYPGVHHAQRLLAAGATSEEVTRLIGNPSGAAPTARELEVARFCEQLTREPSSMTRADVEALRAVGFEDRDIMTIVASAALEDFVGRVAAGTGLRLEADRFDPAVRQAFQVDSADRSSSLSQPASR